MFQGNCDQKCVFHYTSAPRSQVFSSNQHQSVKTVFIDPLHSYCFIKTTIELMSTLVFMQPQSKQLLTMNQMWCVGEEAEIIFWTSLCSRAACLLDYLSSAGNWTFQLHMLNSTIHCWNLLYYMKYYLLLLSMFCSVLLLFLKGQSTQNMKVCSWVCSVNVSL